MNKNIKLIALDLDGTLLNTNGEVSSHGMDVLKQLHNNGIKIMICSGRPVYSIQRIFPETVYDYIGSYNGQIIQNVKTGEEIRFPNLNHTQIERLIHDTDYYPMILSFSRGTEFIHTVSPKFILLGHLYQIAYRLYHILLRRPYWQAKLYTTKQIHEQTCEKFCFASFHFILDRFAKNLDPNQFSYCFVGNHWLEVQAHGVSKGYALRKVMEMEQFKKNEVVAIGDGENDIPMLLEAGTGVAMGNAMPKVKKIADEVTLTCLKDGAIVWLEQNLLDI